jgi:hypothetical protein
MKFDLERQCWSFLETELGAATNRERKATTQATAAALDHLRVDSDKLFGIPATALPRLPSSHAFGEKAALPRHLVDYAWTTWGPALDFDPRGGDKAPGLPFETLIAARVSLGSKNAPVETFGEAVLACHELADVKARLKVLVYRCHVGGRSRVVIDYVRAFEHAVRHRRSQGPRERWVFVGLPWDEAWKPYVYILGRMNGQTMLMQPSWVPQARY